MQRCDKNVKVFEIIHFISVFEPVRPSADGLAYSALLKNELLGAGIDKVQDPQSEDRRLQPATPTRRSLFKVTFYLVRRLTFL